ncbi:MAG: DNA-binding transcriptional regulator [Melioribacteraceae bacterium]|nr:DNA-binding transcriptional regulator [Melioribacteraceae bacterium]
MKKIVLLIETSREFGRQLINGVARYSRINGPWSFFKEQTGLKTSIPRLTSWKPDGIIMRNSMIKQELLKLKIPTILALHDKTSHPKLPVIKTDSQAIAKMASEHFRDKGFKNFAFCGFDIFEWSNERKLFFTKYNNEAGFTTHLYDSSKKLQSQDWEVEQRHVIEWLKSIPKPVALMACNDDRGQHILEVCKLIGLKVPDDVSVIGVDNDPMICEIGDPPLTSIALDVESAGYNSAKLLNDLLSGTKMNGQQIIVSPTHIVQRQSSDIFAVNDPEITKALKFIRENAKSKICVKEVVNSTCLSRRILEKRFRDILHRSIYDEIRRRRVDLITKFLIETDLPIAEITSLFTFTDAEHISRYFKKEKGMGLREFRKLHQPC